MKPSEVALIIGSIALFCLLQAQTGPDYQEWTLQPAGAADKVRLTLDVNKRGETGRHRWRNSNDIPWAAIRGLTAEQLARHGEVKFEIAHDAGRLRCEGHASGNKATGTFQFVPSPSFSAELSRLGYSAPTEEQAFRMMMSEVTLEFARTVTAANLRASTGDLLDLRVHGVDATTIEQARDAGYTDLSARDHIQFRIHGVKADFLRGLKVAGWNYEPQDIVQLRIHGVTSDYMTDLKAAGYGSLPAHEVKNLRIHGIDKHYLRGLQSHGLTPPAGELVQMRNHGVQPDYLQALREAGYENLSSQETVQLRTHGVPAQFVREASSLGFRFSPHDLVQLRNHGVDAEYLRKLKDAGFQSLSADKIAKLRMHGVD